MAATTGLLAQATPTPAPTPTAATEPEGEIVELTPFEVSGHKDTGYQATETLAGTRIRTDLRDVGSAISVITKDFLNDVGATDNQSLLQYTTNSEIGGTRSTYAGLGNGTSVSEQATLASPSSNNRIRGLSQADNTRDFFVSDIPWDGFNIDRVDIQRGPNSILFGLGKPAGIINASLRNADFRDTGNVEYRFGSYGSQRASIDINQQLIPKVLAIRVAGLMDHEKFQQEPAFEDDERIYGTIRLDPNLFNNKDFHTSIRVKAEHGEIDANRPRTITPNDHITPWFNPTEVSDSNPFGGMNKLLLKNGATAQNETARIAGDNVGQANQNDPDYNAWIAGRGNQQQPFYFMDGATSQLYQLYGGYVNKGSRTSTGAVRSASSSLEGLNYAGVFYGVQSLQSYATNAKLPGNQYGQYREMSLTDASIFDFYNTLIDGNNKSESEEWDAYNFSVSQTGWGDRVGIELNYDKQTYDRKNSSALGYAPSIDIDILQNFQDGSANSNVGRPYIQTNGSASSYSSEREFKRASVFAEFRASDITDNRFLRKLVGRHRFNGVFGDEEFYRENTSWMLYGTRATFDEYTGVPLPFNDRPPTAFVYLGGSLLNNTSASGANIPGVTSNISLNDGSMYHFSSEWKNYDVNYNDTWTIPSNLTDFFTAPTTGTKTLYQNSNPANYVGWNSNYYLDILRAEDGDGGLTTRASKELRKVKSYAGTWQSFWWDGALVGTLGWRYDEVRGKDVAAEAFTYTASGSKVSTSRSTVNLSEDVFKLPNEYTSNKAHSLSWGGVLHLNKLLRHDPLPINVSLSYNTSDNFEISGTRRNIYGDVLGNPTGKTKDYGILLSTKDDRFSFRAVKYEASVQNATTEMSNMNMFGDIVALGLRWANVFEYNLNAYTMDTANGSSEWRYNFDPDTAAGETQDQATAKENASIAAWRQIQAHLPQNFYEYWGFDPSKVEAYKVRWSGGPQGLTVTSDTESKGYEFELTANPTRNWRISFNASKTEAVRSNVGGADVTEFVTYMQEMLAGPAGQMRMYSGGPRADTLLKQWNGWVGSYTLMKLQEGSATSELRKWRFNLVTNYTFREGFLKGVGIGGGYRWQDKIVLSYPVVPLSTSAYSYDLSNPYYGPKEDAIDLWASYERKLTKKINWKIQLNVRNAFADDGLIPVSIEPDGKTWATVRVKPTQEWFITNTFSY